MYKLQAITLSPNSSKANTEPIDIPLLRQQVNILFKFQFIIISDVILKLIIFFSFLDTWCRYFTNYSFL